MSRLTILGLFFAYEPPLFFEHAPLVRFPSHKSPGTFLFVTILCTLVRFTSHKTPKTFFLSLFHVQLYFGWVPRFVDVSRFAPGKTQHDKLGRHDAASERRIRGIYGRYSLIWVEWRGV